MPQGAVHHPVRGGDVHPHTARADVVAGFSEYYVPGGVQQVLAILKNNNTLPDNNMHNVITLPITTPNLTIYYDHWENGYLTEQPGMKSIPDMQSALR